MMIQRDSSETVCFGQAVFYFYVGDMEMRNSRTLDKNRKERNDFSEMASLPAG